MKICDNIPHSRKGSQHENVNIGDSAFSERMKKQTSSPFRKIQPNDIRSNGWSHIEILVSMYTLIFIHAVCMTFIHITRAVLRAAYVRGVYV